MSDPLRQPTSEDHEPEAVPSLAASERPVLRKVEGVLTDVETSKRVTEATDELVDVPDDVSVSDFRAFALSLRTALQNGDSLVETLEPFADQLEALAMRAARAEAEALIDSLTGLLNRRAWDRRLADEQARCERYGHGATVVAIDLDLLKEVNDAAGHSAGDRLLRRTASVLRGEARPYDAVARVGGDEFAVLAVQSTASSDVLGARFQRALTDAGIAASVGAAAQETTLVVAWEQADRAMYAAKRAKRMRR